MVRAYTYKLLRSPFLYLGIAGVIGLCCTNFLNYGFTHGDVVGHVEVFFIIGIYRKAMTVFAALPFAANFADEWTNGVSVSCVSRRGVKRYAAANFLFCAVSAWLTVFLGMMVFCGLYSLVVPFYEPDGNPHGSLFGWLLDEGRGEIYLTLRILVFSVSCAMWAAMGMALSALFPNRYVAVSAPFVASYVVERVTIQFPDRLNLWYLSISAVSFESDLLGLLYCVGMFLAISAACGIVFGYLVRRRVQNGFT